MYCVHCRKKTSDVSTTYTTSSRGGNMAKASCGDCGGKKASFVKKNKGAGFLNDAINNLPFEAHLFDEADDGTFKQHSYTGPGTKLDERLKSNSQPINALDRASQKHDICYSQNKDTKTRVTTCDPPLEASATQILNNPKTTFVQKANAKLVQQAMRAKVKFQI